MIRFSANTGFLWKERPFLERLVLAAKHKFQALEFHDEAQGIDLEELSELLQVLQMPVLSLNTRMRGNIGCAALPDCVAQARDDIDAGLHIAEGIDAKALHILSGKTLDENAFSAFIENLKYALYHSKCVILIEPISPEAIPGYWMNSFDKVLDVISEINHPRLKILFDFFHAWHLLDDMEEFLFDHLNRIGHIQIASLPDRHEPSNTMPDYQQFLPKLVDAGYCGWFGCEYHPKENIEDGLEYLNWFG